MKLEKNMYVRTKNGYIRKIDRIWNDTDFNVDKIYYNDNIDEDTLGCVLDEDIKGNPSFNIIDLIEVGDYVNGYLVLEKDIRNKLRYIDLEDRIMKYVEYLDINSIVTKEQFESMKYRIGD